MCKWKKKRCLVITVGGGANHEGWWWRGGSTVGLVIGRRLAAGRGEKEGGLMKGRRRRMCRLVVHKGGEWEMEQDSRKDHVGMIMSCRCQGDARRTDT